MKGKLRSESLPSAIYDAIVILHAANAWVVLVGRNENVSRKTHSSPLSLSPLYLVGFLNASPHQQLEETHTPTSIYLRFC